MRCNICYTELGPPLYEATTNQALTSLCQLRRGRVKVWLCPNCGHLRGEALPDTRNYYALDYRILLDNDEEDQIYEVQGDCVVYRTDHQVATLQAKLNLPDGARLLDFGCAKAITPRRLLSSRPDLQIHLFDVSEMYTRYWQQFLSEQRWAVHDIPTSWKAQFDVVTSFFSLEHIPDPLGTVSQIADLLASDGVFYGIVPDTFRNVADFVVIDHVNHFTDVSLHALLRAAGFADICVDSGVHRGALVFTARKAGPETERPDLASSLVSSRQLAKYWGGLGDRIRAAEAAHPSVPAAIYGSGFYGAYIASILDDPGRVVCFLDASPYQQGKTLFGHAILPPPQLADTVRLLYVALNPLIARDAVANMSWLRDRSLTLVFLDGDAT